MFTFVNASLLLIILFYKISKAHQIQRNASGAGFSVKYAGGSYFGDLPSRDPTDTSTLTSLLVLLQTADKTKYRPSVLSLDPSSNGYLEKRMETPHFPVFLFPWLNFSSSQESFSYV